MGRVSCHHPPRRLVDHASEGLLRTDEERERILLAQAPVSHLATIRSEGELFEKLLVVVPYLSKETNEPDVDVAVDFLLGFRL